MIPARLDRPSSSPFHTRMVAGLGAAWILDGLQITIASSVKGVLIQPDTLDMTSTEVGLIASVYLVGHRRPVRRDQLRDRRDDAVEVSRPCRHLDQRDLLGRSDPRLLRLARLPERVRPECRVAARVPDGACPRDRRDPGGKDSAREPALAHDSWPDGGGGARAGQDRGGRAHVGPGAGACRRLAGARARSRKTLRLRHVPRAGLPYLPQAGGPRRDAHDHSVVPVQRHLLCLRAGAR